MPVFFQFSDNANEGHQLIGFKGRFFEDKTLNSDPKGVSNVDRGARDTFSLEAKIA